MWHGLSLSDLSLSQELMTIGMVLYYRSVPVISLPVDCLWPASSILHFPTQIPGSLHALDKVLILLNYVFGAVCVCVCVCVVQGP